MEKPKHISFNSIMEDSNTGMASLKLKQLLLDLKLAKVLNFLGTSYESIIISMQYYLFINNSPNNQIFKNISDIKIILK